MHDTLIKKDRCLEVLCILMFFYRVGGNLEGSVHVEDLRVNSDKKESCRLFRQINSQSEDRVSLHGKTSLNMYVSALGEGNNYWFLPEAIVPVSY